MNGIEIANKDKPMTMTSCFLDPKGPTIAFFDDSCLENAIVPKGWIIKRIHGYIPKGRLSEPDFEGKVIDPSTGKVLVNVRSGKLILEGKVFDPLTGKEIIDVIYEDEIFWNTLLEQAYSTEKLEEDRIF